MNITKPVTLVGAVTITALSLFCTLEQSVQAGTLHNGWNIAIDPSYDSLAGNGNGGITAGNTIYEIYALAIKDDVDTNSIWVAINSNLALTGKNTGSRAGNGNPISNSNIGWGDLLLDFSGKGNFKNANDSRSLLGIRFAANNDSKAPSIGVYSNVKAVSVVAQNDGWSNLYNNNVNGVRPRTGKDARTGDLAWNDPYYSPYTSLGSWSNPQSLFPNVIESGAKIGDITLLSDSELFAAGFDQGFLPAAGSQTLGFKLDKSLLPVGDFIATLAAECFNDAIALLGNVSPLPPPPPPPPPTQPVPEPAGVLGLLVTSLIFGASQVRKQQIFSKN